MMRVLRAAALALPLVALVLLAGWRELELREAVEWRIPVSGVDPLDQLRGRFVLVRLDWTLEGPVATCGPDGAGCALCLERKGADVVAKVGGLDSACPARVEPRRSRLDFLPALPAPAPARPPDAEAGPSPLPERQPGFVATVYLPEREADALDAALREGRPVELVARLTRGGRLVPQSLVPGPHAARSARQPASSSAG